MNKAILGLSVAALLLGASDARAEKERTRFFELQPQIGYSWVNLTGFNQGNFIEGVEQDLSVEEGDVPVEGSGFSAGLGAQFKAWVFVVGARYNLTSTQDFGLHTVAGDLGLRLGDEVALYGRAGLGLAFMSSLPEELKTNGFVIPASGGLDFKINDAASLGVGLDVEVLLMTQAQKLRDAVSGELRPEEVDRDSAGFQIRPQLHFTWHI